MNILLSINMDIKKENGEKEREREKRGEERVRIYNKKD